MFSANSSQVSNAANYIEDVFSTYLYTGNGSTQTITNGIDLAGKGGLVWQKMRSDVASHLLTDTARGSGYALVSNSTGAQFYNSSIVSSFNSNGFTDGGSQASGATYASWTFRKQPKFFDVQTFTYPLSGSITVNHSLGSTPGCIFVKATDGADNWYVYHRMMNNGTNPSNYYMLLNSTGAQVNNFASWITVGSTSITFPSGALNPGSNFVMYLFAHNAGGFGLTGTDNVISCGSYTGNGSASGQVITLGYEPQFLIVKPAVGNTGDWQMYDVMRGMSFTDDAYLAANSSAAEFNLGASYYAPLPTGFQVNTASNINNQSGTTYIYIAIRRGPMKVPTSGTSVFTPAVFTDVDKLTTAGFSVDAAIEFQNITTSNLQYFSNRLTAPKALNSRSTAAETTETQVWASNTQVQLSNQGNSYKRLYHMFRRAPSFMDVVCFNGVDSGTKSVSHNLQAVPELIITKARNDAVSWYVYSATLGINKWLRLNATDAEASSAGAWGSTPTSTAFTATTTILASAATNYVAYLFATCAGVSKVGNYTGNGSTQTIDCGFTGGARFVLIKRTDSTGDWYVYDTARGMTTLTDPYLLLNSTAAESATLGSVTTVSTGFALNAGILAAINTNGASYIFLAIA